MVDADIKLKEALRDKAAQDLENWYEQRRSAIERRKAANSAENSNDAPEPVNGVTTATEPKKYEYSS